MQQHDRARFDRALTPARHQAYPAGEFVEQESFMRASEILDLAIRAGVGPQTTVLDVCCGVAGPGRLIARKLGCAYLGVDSSAEAVGLARERAVDHRLRFAVAQVPPLPAGRFDVVLLLETLLAFPDKQELLHAVSAALSVGGRFALTVEAGEALTQAERGAMPDADTVWPTPLSDLLAALDRAGLRVRWQVDQTSAQLQVIDSLHDAYVADASYIAAQAGRRALDDLVAAHQLWGEWLRTGRVRKFALVADKVS